MNTQPRTERLTGLQRFAIGITSLNVLGHLVFGFEAPWIYPICALITAYTMELVLEFIDAKSAGREPRYKQEGLNFFLSAHISGMACSMLLYANDHVGPIIFATVVSIASKTLFRIYSSKSSRHFLNPSNFGITVTLLVFPWVGPAQAYQFTENLGMFGDILLPLFFITTGSLLNLKCTGRVPLIMAWLLGFVLQAVARHLLLDSSLVGALIPMTGPAFLLYTFYMITDPATTPSSTRNQILFGGSVAILYGIITSFHFVYGIFISLTIICCIRGGWMWWSQTMENRRLYFPLPQKA